MWFVKWRQRGKYGVSESTESSMASSAFSTIFCVARSYIFDGAQAASRESFTFL